ncbi:hypothetical protein GCM10023328_47170 [Modestobacter marinus]|uniref:Uncharacterized protein n=1 Tax=Modestobacter marinus TaxID=477641 RepID=A0A846LV76_9ACTN|nr:hypothetical protein [Modestobacter marinus]NIH70294.1 hypothetical protein [Modestobacter marinus]GGL83882.1 hypothetical protein GCM10011589_45370 [Modestobacter marinus]
MTVEWFDLGQRLHAAATGRPAPRLLHAPLPPLTDPVAVRARAARGRLTVTAATPGQPPATAEGEDALALLRDLGVVMNAVEPPTLVTDDPMTLPLLLTAARTTAPEGELADVAAAIGWWADRDDFPGGVAVVHLPAACRRAWTTGTVPEDERDPGIWRTWLDVDDEGPVGMLAVLDRLTTGPTLPLLDVLAEDDTYSWGKAQSEHAQGWNWRTPDTTSRAATGLRARCDAADLFAAALLADPLHRQRAVHTGHVVTGTASAGETKRQGRITCARLDARLRTGNAVTGWTGPPSDTAAERFTATVAGTEVAAGRLVLTLTGYSGPTGGEPVTLAPTAPNPRTMRQGRSRYRRLYATRTSWLTTGRTPTPVRRDVPLELLVAGAED